MRRKSAVGSRFLAAGALCLLVAARAQASLGGGYASVEADRAHLAAKLVSTSVATFTVHALTLANGGVVREFMRGDDGVIFAISWRGPGRPDLRQLLGDRFAILGADNTSHQISGRRPRMPLAVSRADFVVRTGGHSGAFWGFAYLPQQAPSGFSASNLQ